MSEITNYQQAPNMPVTQNVPMGNINQGTIAIESQRAIAEAQAKLLVAQRFPRDEIAAYNRMYRACQRKSFAEKAFFNFPRAGGSVSGPTIRLAEELARCWGNVDYGIKELSQDNGKSEMQAYAWDLETNTISSQTFTNPHMREVTERDPVTGRKVSVNKELTSIRDIYEINANMGARRMRSRILAVLPADFVEAAVSECKKTLAGQNDEPLIDRVKRMVVQFGKLGVTKEMLEKRLGFEVSKMNADDFAEYVGIYTSIKDKETRIAEWFERKDEHTALNEALKAEGAEKK